MIDLPDDDDGDDDDGGELSIQTSIFGAIIVKRGYLSCVQVCSETSSLDDISRQGTL